jgi:hypothetical protein
MAKRALEKLGKLLVKDLRDPAIQHFDLLAKAHYRARPFGRLQDRLAKLTDLERRLVRECVVAAVDCGLDAFLQAVQFAEGRGTPITIDGQELGTPALALDAKLNAWIAKWSGFPA